MGQQTVVIGDAVSVYRTKYNANFDELYERLAAETTLTIATGVITRTQENHIVAAESGTADDIITISGLADGEWLYIRPDSGDTITVNDNSGTGTNIDLAGFPTAVILTTNMTLAFRGDGTNAVLKWVSPNVTSVVTKVTSLAIADLGDTSTPSVLTDEETNDTLISNFQSSGADHVFTMPAPHTKGKGVFLIGDEFQVDIEPNSSDLFFLNGTAMAADEHIVNSADTLGESISYYAANINGTLRWMFKSSDAAWVEASP